MPRFIIRPYSLTRLGGCVDNTVFRLYSYVFSVVIVFVMTIVAVYIVTVQYYKVVGLHLTISALSLIISISLTF
jgi:hypothetical protein